eukprot:scaffold57355_cov48-Phaeocystis_antarctica.AAC.2
MQFQPLIYESDRTHPVSTTPQRSHERPATLLTLPYLTPHDRPRAVAAPLPALVHGVDVRALRALVQCAGVLVRV